MKTYTLTDARNRHGEVFDQAVREPILLTKQSRPSHVILSAQAFQDMSDRLQELEDLLWAEAAQKQLEIAKRVGSEKFTQALEQLAHGEA